MSAELQTIGILNNQLKAPAPQQAYANHTIA